MDLSQLKTLGEIAGIGGIALGIIALLLRDLIGSVAGIPKKDRARVVTFIAGGCFVIGALGIAAWAFGNQPRQATATTTGGQSPAIVNGGDAQVTYGGAAAPTGQAGAPTQPPPASVPNGSARTEGSQSPAIVSGGNASVQYAAPPAAAGPSDTK